jgi:hypothetical protein
MAYESKSLIRSCGLLVVLTDQAAEDPSPPNVSHARRLRLVPDRAGSGKSDSAVRPV